MKPHLLDKYPHASKAYNNLKNSSNETELEPADKAEMQKGVPVKMHKIVGSISALLLFFTKDFMEINCATDLTEPVKQKWRMAVF